MNSKEAREQLTPEQQRWHDDKMAYAFLGGCSMSLSLLILGSVLTIIISRVMGG